MSNPAAPRYYVEGGFRSSELLLLQRAIGFYNKHYQNFKASTKLQFEKDEAQSYIEAADALSKRLRHELKKEE